MRATVTTLILASAVLTGADARAQSRVDVVPSVMIGSTYDDNLFAQVQGDAGQMFTVRPGLEATVESPRLNLGTLWSFDAQRSNHPDLDMVDARRHADMNMSYRSTNMTTVGLITQYDRSDTPGEINLTSGILNQRQEAYRWEVSPNFAHRFGLHTNATASYDFTDESLLQNGTGQMHVVRANLAQDYTERTTLSGGYLERTFVDPFDINSSYTVLGGINRQTGSATRVTFQAGPRVSTYRGLAAEVVAELTHTTNRVGMAIDYWHGETIVLGIHGPVAVDNGTAKITWPFTRTIEIGSHSSVSDITTLAQQKLMNFHQEFVMSWSPGGLYTVAGSYGLDYQQGLVLNSVYSNADVLRHVFRVSLTVAPRLSRAIRSSDDPAARAKGVTQ